MVVNASRMYLAHTRLERYTCERDVNTERATISNGATKFVGLHLVRFSQILVTFQRYLAFYLVINHCLRIVDAFGHTVLFNSVNLVRG